MGKREDIIVGVLENAQRLYHDDADLTLYTWESHEIRVASVALRQDPSIHLLFTLGSESEVVFASPTSGGVKEVGDAIARVEAHFASKPWKAHYGHVATFEHPYLRAHGRVGVVTASPMALAACEGIPEEIVVAGRAWRVVALVWLSPGELTLATKSGTDALELQWGEQGRDFVTL